jgi:hypothetical protein
LRVEDGAPPELAPLVLGSPRRTAKRDRNARLDKATRSHIFAHWARQASAESASVPAFLALAGDLALAGAPDSLVRASLRSAEEESRHTALCASLAGDYSSGDVSALTPNVKLRPAQDRASLLKRLALESFWDGCVGEGAAAAKAARLAKQTRRGDAALAHSIIAAEEASHAALAEQVLTFCISAGGKGVRDAVAESIEERRSNEEKAISADFTEDRDDIDRDLARACGVPLACDERLGREQAWETSLRLAGRMIAASPLLA